jgi:hypothetical protein
MNGISTEPVSVASKGTTLWRLQELEKKRSSLALGDGISNGTTGDVPGTNHTRTEYTAINGLKADAFHENTMNRPQSTVAPKLSVHLAQNPREDTSIDTKALRSELEETKHQRDDALAQLSRTQGWLKDLELEVIDWQS